MSTKPLEIYSLSEKRIIYWLKANPLTFLSEIKASVNQQNCKWNEKLLRSSFSGPSQLDGQLAITLEYICETPEVIQIKAIVHARLFFVRQTAFNFSSTEAS